ncbi:uncharacterized protein LOC143518212 [Brachyhypopomus gauderio]|uniref:uncharacterized protein LOC143518212 n=1 Tax=Brachyhypopomus gauderio TaxID=698409 RepID=UPI004042FEDC
MEAREESMAEDLQGIDFRGGLVLLPSIFRENIDHLVSFGECEPSTPYPTIQLKDHDWRTTISRRSQSVVKVDGVEVCSCAAVDEAFITTFIQKSTEEAEGDITATVMGIYSIRSQGHQELDDIE